MFASFPNVTCLNSFRVRWSAIPYRTNRTMTFALYTIKIREKKERRNEREFLPSSRFIKFLKIIKESNRFRGKKTETRNEDSKGELFLLLFPLFLLLRYTMSRLRNSGASTADFDPLLHFYKRLHWPAAGYRSGATLFSSRRSTAICPATPALSTPP